MEKCATSITERPIEIPKFTDAEHEAGWWASREGREYVKQNAAGTVKKTGAPKGSREVRQLNRAASVQIALRLPEPDNRQGAGAGHEKRNRIPRPF
jgi:hypothetical protein